ncbi:MAG: 4Fe-4S single cluster domain-containing protein [Eubacteriales bacterium]|jgi:anaerobic ribonucleoside-triphosphate reductase activating protein|nr:4Fe-4S single cluster domain-containing protein [Eubacteriales bacterium]
MLHNRSAKKIVVPALPVRIAGFTEESVVDGPGLRSVIFTQGCPHRCPGCHNPDTHSAEGGYMTDTAELWRKIDANPTLEGITFSGGEPFLWAPALAAIGRAAHEKKLTVLTYTGYTFEELREAAVSDAGIKELLTVTDWLIDGPYIAALRDLTLRFRGSGNQRILDIGAYPGNDRAVVIEPKTAEHQQTIL